MRFARTWPQHSPKRFALAWGFPPIPEDQVNFSELDGRQALIDDLNHNAPPTFEAPPKKKKGSKFRSHPFKAGNMTVSLTNFEPKAGSSETSNGKKWYCSVFLGSGKDFITVPVTKKMYTKVDTLIDGLPDGKKFKKGYLQHFKGKTGGYKELQSIHEQNIGSSGKLLSPTALVEEIAEFIAEYDPTTEMLENVILPGIRKDRFPKRQLLAIWAIGQIIDNK